MRCLASSILTATGHVAVTLNKGLIGWATESVKDLFGWAADDMVGKGLDLLCADQGGYRQTIEGLRRCASDHGFSQFECVCKKRDGSNLLCAVSALKLNEFADGLGENLIIYRDISGEKDAEYALRDSWERYIHLTDSLPQAILEIDETGRLVFINKTGLAILGYTQKDLRNGLNMFDLLEVEDRNRAAAEIARELSVETGRPLEYELIAKAGKRLKMAAYPRRTLNGGPSTGLRTVVLDVSEMLQSKQTLKYMEMKLEERNKALQETNTALKALVREWESEKKEYVLSVTSTIKGSLLPLLEGLKKNRVPPEVGGCLDVLESKLDSLASSLFDALASRYPSLSTKELRVADLIRDGKTTKEIAGLFHITPAAVDFHRNSIRRKLGITGRKVNLQSYLLSLNK
jgi:PAS domain S-box-containing protein